MSVIFLCCYMLFSFCKTDLTRDIHTVFNPCKINQAQFIFMYLQGIYFALHAKYTDTLGLCTYCNNRAITYAVRVYKIIKYTKAV